MFIQSIKYDKEYDRGMKIKLVITLKTASGEPEDYNFSYGAQPMGMSKLFYKASKPLTNGHYPTTLVAKFRDYENVPSIMKKALDFVQAELILKNEGVKE